MRFKVETVTSSKLKGTTWEDVDVGDIAMISISYGITVSHLQFLYVKDGKFSPSVRHGDLIENLEISFYLHKVRVKSAYLMAHIMGFTYHVVVDVVRANGLFALRDRL
ncbi:hypothetical protein KY284_000132 [Solanum tuberosum]|nr:hypothetical protein KY284_000132 [Solanum tuberosum]